MGQSSKTTTKQETVLGWSGKKTTLAHHHRSTRMDSADECGSSEENSLSNNKLSRSSSENNKGSKVKKSKEDDKSRRKKKKKNKKGNYTETDGGVLEKESKEPEVTEKEGTKPVALPSEVTVPHTDAEFHSSCQESDKGSRGAEELKRKKKKKKERKDAEENQQGLETENTTGLDEEKEGNAKVETEICQESSRTSLKVPVNAEENEEQCADLQGMQEDDCAMIQLSAEPPPAPPPLPSDAPVNEATEFEARCVSREALEEQPVLLRDLVSFPPHYVSISCLTRTHRTKAAAVPVFLLP